MNIQSLALVSDFITVDHGKYIVKVSVYGDGVILGSALAAAHTVEQAEDEARKRAIALINTDISLKNSSKNEKISNIEPSIKNEPQNISSSNKSSKTPKKDSPKIKPHLKPVEIEEKPAAEIVTPNASDLWENIPSFPDSEVTTEEDYQDNNSLENISEPIIDQIPIKNQEMTEDVETPNLFNGDGIDENKNNFEDDFMLFSSSNQEENLSSELNLTNVEIVDFSQIIDQTSIEMKRLQWTQDQGKKYLLETYGKKSRHLLSDSELIEFLKYLKTQ